MRCWRWFTKLPVSGVYTNFVNISDVGIDVSAAPPSNSVIRVIFFFLLLVLLSGNPYLWQRYSYSEKRLNHKKHWSNGITFFWSICWQMTCFVYSWNTRLPCKVIKSISSNLIVHGSLYEALNSKILWEYRFPTNSSSVKVCRRLSSWLGYYLLLGVLYMRHKSDGNRDLALQRDKQALCQWVSDSFSQSIFLFRFLSQLSTSVSESTEVYATDWLEILHALCLGIRARSCCSIKCLLNKSYGYWKWRTQDFSPSGNKSDCTLLQVVCVLCVRTYGSKPICGTIV